MHGHLIERSERYVWFHGMDWILRIDPGVGAETLDVVVFMFPEPPWDGIPGERLIALRCYVCHVWSCLGSGLSSVA